MNQRAIFTHSTAVFVIFMACFWFIHLMILSIVTSFHFLLEHSFLTIESWVLDRAWFMASLTVLLTFAVVTKFLLLKSSERAPLRQILLSQIQRPGQVLWVVILFVWLAFLFNANLVSNELTNLDVFKVITNYLGVLVLFSCLSLFLLITELIYPLNQYKSVLRSIVFSFIFFFFFKFTFMYGLAVTGLVIVLFLFIHLNLILKLKWSDIIYLLIFLIAPILALTGIDPFWAQSYSPWISLNKEINLVFGFLLLLSTVYVRYKQK